MIGRARSWLYVPAHQPGLLAKAMAGEADAVVLDLEDAVPAAAKEDARRNARLAAARSQPKPLWMRVNPPGTPEGAADLAALAGTPAGGDPAGGSLAGVRVAKAEDPAAVANFSERVGAPVHLLIETALGVENAFVLARCHPAVAVVSLGEADLMADLRVRDPGALDWARQRVIVANRAAGLPSPPHAVWTDVADLAGLAEDTAAARDRGFFGRSLVHPRQVETVNRIFTPSPAEVERARDLLAARAARSESGTTAWLDDQGRLIDPAVVAGARWVVDLADSLATGRMSSRS
ncbi:MAG: CoA ester lyase [Nocardiopsaceae bacterium]|nr:CoA ester lyase [Nocardiopsaceae bacterium]